MPTKTVHTTGTRPPRNRTAARAAARKATQAAAKASVRQHQRRSWLLWGLAAIVVAGLIAGMMYTARDTQSSTTRVAPGFTLTNTDGRSVHLADYRGKNVVLYFNEGAGCQSCLTQMVDIEQHAKQFDDANITVLPIVMNTAEQIRKDMAATGVKTPFLIDAGGSVSRAYGTLGKGMHAGLPGHSFVLVDAKGTQRWYGEYPSMYLSSADLLKQVHDHLRG